MSITLNASLVTRIITGASKAPIALSFPVGEKRNDETGKVTDAVATFRLNVEVSSITAILSGSLDPVYTALKSMVLANKDRPALKKEVIRITLPKVAIGKGTLVLTVSLRPEYKPEDMITLLRELEGPAPVVVPPAPATVPEPDTVTMAANPPVPEPVPAPKGKGKSK